MASSGSSRRGPGDVTFAVLPAEDGERLDKLLARAVPWLGRSGARSLVAAGQVVLTRDGRTHRPRKGDACRTGDVVRAELAAPSLAAVPEPALALTVVHETELLVVCDKPAGQPTAPLRPGETGTLANALVARYPEMQGVGFSPREPGLVHRLDTGTSGLVLAARSAQAFAALRGLLEAGALDKRYLLVCRAEGLAARGRIEVPLSAGTGKDRARTRAWPEGHPGRERDVELRPARTDYEVRRRVGDWALVEARAARAFRHQIRAHFAALGHPIAGDELYGGARVPGLTRQALHASRLAYAGDARIEAFAVESELPDDVVALVGGARGKG